MVIIQPQALEEAYKTIELLFDRIKSISEKAERSEQTVSNYSVIEIISQLYFSCDD